MLGNIIAGGLSLLGGILGQNKQDKQAELNRQTQLDYAQNAIQWKTADAQKAGIHPIYALGAPSMNYSPVSVGDSLSPAISNAGQHLGRAINSTSSAETRATAYTSALQHLQLERAGLENELLKSNLARNRLDTNPAPPTPDQAYGIPGQGPTALPGAIKEKTERQGWNPSDPSNESHAVADTGWVHSGNGTWSQVPSKDAKERIEDMKFYEWQHFARNNIAPYFAEEGFKGPFPPPTGSRWAYNPLTGRAWLVPVEGPGRFATPGLRNRR